MPTLSPIPAPGTVVRFLSELRATGRPVIRLRGQGDWRSALLLIETEASNDPEIPRLLAIGHREAAADLGGPPLPFDETAAVSAARFLFRAAWCYLQRDTGKDEVARLLLEKAAPFSADAATAAPEPLASLTAAAQFSADLTLQHLPAIFRMAQALAPGDPLLAALQHLAGRFPLSGVGIPPADSQVLPSVHPGTWENLHSHPGLRQLFLDRIATSRDRSWLNHPDIALAIRHALGQYSKELAPSLTPHPSPPSQTFPPPANNQ